MLTGGMFEIERTLLRLEKMKLLLSKNKKKKKEGNV